MGRIASFFHCSYAWLIFASIIYFSFSTSQSYAQSVDQTLLCSRPEVQSTCQSSCGALCQNKAFLLKNVDFCVQQAAFGGSSKVGVPVDSKNCEVLFAVVDSGNDKTDTGGTSEKIAVVDCSKYEKLSEQLECESRGQKPPCSQNTPELVENANLLVVEIESELKLYGDLLTTDFLEVKNRDLLCQFSRDGLDEKYALATKNPAVLNGLQGRAKGIQACSTDWEKYLETADEGVGSDKLGDNVIKAIRDDLEFLRPKMRELSKSVTTLKDASTKIRKIARFHLAVCPAQGVPLPNRQGDTTKSN